MTPVAPHEQHSLAWTDLFGLARKYFVVTIVVAVAATLGTWATLQIFYTDEYETQTSILVKIGRENAQIPASVQNGSLLTQGVRIQDINSEVQMLSANALVEKVVDQLGPAAFKSVLQKPDSILGYPKYGLKRVARSLKDVYKDFLIAVNIKKRLTDREDAIEALAYGRKVEPVKESDVLTLKVRLPSAKLAVDCAYLLVQEYFSTRAQVRHTAAGSSFFDNELTKLQVNLDKLRTERAAIRRNWELSSPGEQRSILLKELANIRDRVDASDAEINRLSSQRELVSEKASSTADMLTKEQVVALNPSIQSIKEQLTKLQLERARVSERYGAQSSVLAKSDSEITSLRKLLAEESPTIVATTTSEANPLKKDLVKDLENHEVQLAGLEREKSSLKEPELRIRAELNRLNLGSDAFEAIEREYQLAEQSYLLDVKRLQEAKLNDELDEQRVANVSVIGPPDQPIEPIYPPKPFLMAIAPVVGLLIGIAFSALLESMDDRIATVADVEAIPGLNYLGSFLSTADGLSLDSAPSRLR